MHFASDNAGPVAPQIMDALMRANAGYASAYGTDEIMKRVTQQMRTLFEAPEAVVYLVSTGTSANVLSLSILANAWDAIYCHQHAHIEEDECGAPEFFTGGAKLTLLGGQDAKIDAQEFRTKADNTGHLGVHGVQRGVLSITNVTEQGTVYTLEEIQNLTRIARDYGIRCHLDGARFANALVSLGCTPAEMTWKSGIEVLSFGGTKNGLMGVEAVILFDPSKAWEFELRRKRGGHLVSKHRYLSAQMEAYLHNDLWRTLARQANEAADHLASALGEIPEVRLLHPQDANMLFCGWSRLGHQRLQSAGAEYYYWPFSPANEGPNDEFISARLVCNWATNRQEIDELAALIKG